MKKPLEIWEKSFLVYIKAKDIYVDIAKDVETRFDNSSYKLKRPLSRVENKNVIGLMKNEWGGKLMIEFSVLIRKT